MASELEDGSYRYEPVQDWAKLPEDWQFVDVSGVAVDASDNVFVLCRGTHPVVVFDKQGNYLRHFGDGQFDRRAHGIHAGADGFIYTVNDNQHCVRKWTPEGKLVMTIGKEFEPAEKWGGMPFNTPTNAAVSPKSGDVYITDGYGNSRVHRYSADGRHILSWGDAGVGPGEFQIPHNVVIDEDEWVFVTDRENNRLQVFDNTGKLEAIWDGIYRPQALCMDADGLIYIGEMLNHPDLKDHPGIGHRLNVFSHTGERLAHLGDKKLGDDPTQFIAPHGFGVDSVGNLYVGEVSRTVYGGQFDPPRTYKCFRKLTRLF
jgi:DNA-binding beta-propeller fold protein YncE